MNKVLIPASFLSMAYPMGHSFIVSEDTTYIVSETKTEVIKTEKKRTGFWGNLFSSQSKASSGDPYAALQNNDPDWFCSYE